MQWNQIFRASEPSISLNVPSRIITRVPIQHQPFTSSYVEDPTPTKKTNDPQFPSPRERERDRERAMEVTTMASSPTLSSSHRSFHAPLRNPLLPLRSDPLPWLLRPRPRPLPFRLLRRAGARAAAATALETVRSNWIAFTDPSFSRYSFLESN